MLGFGPPPWTPQQRVRLCQVLMTAREITRRARPQTNPFGYIFEEETDDRRR